MRRIIPFALAPVCLAVLSFTLPTATLAGPHEAGKSVNQQAATSNPPLGLVAKAVSAQIGNATASDGETVYSGDFLTTQGGGTLLVNFGNLSLELESNSSAHVYKAPYGVVVELNSGSALYHTPGGQQNLVIVASDVRVTPVLTSPDLGRVSLDDPCKVSVYSQRGQAAVQTGSETKVIEQGKAYHVAAMNSISSRQYLSPDADDYHDSHEHKPCAIVQTVKGHGPIAAGQSRFVYVAAGTAAIITLIPVLESFESPKRP